MKNKWIKIIAIAVAIAALAVGGIIYWNISNSYVAMVGNEKITKAEFNFFLTQAKSEMEANAVDENEKKALWESTIDGKSAKDTAKDNALKYAKEFKINLIKVKESKTVLTAEESKGISDYIDQVVKEQGGRNATEELLKQEYGMTLTEYKKFYTDYYLYQKYMSEAPKTLTVNDADIQSFYSQYMESAEVVTVRHILISTLDANGAALSADKVAEAKKKAEDILAKVKAGGDFNALVMEYSEDEGTKEDKGQATFGKGETVQAFEDWGFKAKPGDVGMITTDYGYHVMKKPTLDEMKKDDYESLKSNTQQYKLVKELESISNDPKYDLKINQGVFKSIQV